MAGKFRYIFDPFEQQIFQLKDIVVLKSGHAPQIVVDYKIDPYRVQWIKTKYYRTKDSAIYDTDRWRQTTDFKFYEYDPEYHDYENSRNQYIVNTKSKLKSEPKKEESNMSKLYQTLEETPRFGMFLANNSSGQIVLEMKGASGAVEAFDRDKIEEVKPYTISVNYISTGASGHYESAKGRVNEGDILMFPEGALAIVTAINTGYTGRTNVLPEKIRRLISEEI